MDEEDKAVMARSVKDVHKALGMWSIRRALAVAFTGAAVLLVAAWYLVSWMLGSPPKAKAEPLDTSAQLDLLKLVFALVAGIGALVALVTAYRRQRIEEAAGERAERIQAHAEQVARDNVHDATERRVTDLYGKAVEQLGHDKAAVRLGGLYALERLAQDHPQHRQTVVDVVCAYLRMPFHYSAPTTTTPQPEQASQSLPSETQEGDPRQELQVRLTAQRLLVRHLQFEPLSWTEDPPTYLDNYWAEIDLDLAGTRLFNLDLSDCRLHCADFIGAQFLGVARFDGVQFSGDARFDGAQFSAATRSTGAQFRGAQFRGAAQFAGAQFSGMTSFSGTQFSGGAGFNGAQFNGETWFERAQFSAGAGFKGAQFNGDARFDKAEFSRDVWFDKAEFRGATRFDKAEFERELYFVGATACLPDDQHLWPPGWRTGSPSPDQDMVPLVREHRQPDLNSLEDH